MFKQQWITCDLFLLCTSVAVVIAFFICWAPFHVQRLIAIYGTGTDGISSKTKWFEALYYIFTYISGVLYYISTTINPILYNIMSHKFREAFMVSLSLNSIAQPIVENMVTVLAMQCMQKLCTVTFMALGPPG